MSITDFSIPPSEKKWIAGAVIELIKPYTTPDHFLELLKVNPEYTLNMAGHNGETALSKAARVGNVDLIDFIVKIGRNILLREGDHTGKSPLHYASLCLIPENGYLAAKRLLQLESPINIVKSLDIGDTPLETALNKERIKIAILLLRLGGITRSEHLQDNGKTTLEVAKKQIMTDGEMIFSIGMFQQKTLPRDVVKQILFISSKLL